MKSTTVEGRAKTKNGVTRLVFSVICILLEVIFIILMFTKLNRYAEAVNLLTRVVGVIVILNMYASPVTSTIKVPWILLILMFPIMGLGLYLLVGLNGGTEKMRRRYQKIDEQLLPLLPENRKIQEKLQQKIPRAGNISSYIHRNAAYPVYQNTDVTYFDEAAKGLEAQLQDLAKAEQFIFMEYHAIEDAEAWHRIQQVLEDRVKAGVEVRVFYDDMGSIGFINTDFTKKMEAVGIRCRVFNPFMPGLNLFLNNRDHRKITVIDGKVGFTGGYNLANEYFNLTHPYGQWKDTGIRLEGDAVRSLTVTFLEMWNAVNDKDENDTDFARFLLEYPYKAQQTGFVQPYADSPLDRERVGENVYMNIIKGATEYVYFITPYLIISDEMKRELGLAAKRGIDVRIVTPGIPDKKLVYRLTRSYYAGLIRDGVRVYEYTPGFCHAKQCLCDGKIASIGSSNFDYRSLYHHFENDVLLYGCDAIGDMARDFDALFSQCSEVTQRYSTGSGAILRMWQCILRLFAPLV